jgi:hypothetical protein
MPRPQMRIGALAALISLFLFSCAAKKAAVRVPDAFTGKIRIDACKAGAAADEIVIDREGHGETSVCTASRDLRQVVVRPFVRQG